MAGVDYWVCRLGGLASYMADFFLSFSLERCFETVEIVLVGKYITLEDSYMSVVKSLEHAAMRCGRKLILHVRSLTTLYILHADSTLVG